MTREFHAWPHTARKIVEESLREFVGDGEGEDYEVLTTFINEVQAEALRDAAMAARRCWTGRTNLPDPNDPEVAHSFDRWLDVRADRLTPRTDR